MDLQERIVAHDVDEVELLHLLKVLERHVHVAALHTGVQRTVVDHRIHTHTALLQTLLASASEFGMLEEGPRGVVSAIAAFTPSCSLDESQNSCTLDERSRERPRCLSLCVIGGGDTTTDVPCLPSGSTNFVVVSNALPPGLGTGHYFTSLC